MSDDFAFSSKEVDRRQAESEYPEFVGPVYVDGDDARRKESILSPLSPIIPKDRHFSETSDSILAEHVHSVADGATEELKSSSIHQAAGTSKKIGWHRISTTWRVVLGLAVVGIILLAALLGHFLGAKSSGTSTSPPDAFDILPTSQLAASTWRDADNNTVKTVFFQDSSLAIIMAKRNSTTDGWYFQNVSASVEGSYLLPKAGTPLQSTAPDYVNAENFWVELFFVAVGNHPSQIWSWNLPGKKDAWYTDTLQGFETIFPTGFLDGTQLAVYRDQCGASCSGSSRLVCQAGNRDLMMAYSNVSTITTWTGAWNVTDLSEDGQGWFAPDGLPPLETNASLAVTRYSPGPGMDPSGMRLYYDVSGQLLEYLYVNGSWTKGTFEALLGDQYQPPHVDAVAYPSSNSSSSLDSILVTIPFENGTVAVQWQSPGGGESWKTGFVSSPGNVTALAINADLKAYCLTNGQIVEYDVDGSDPTSWTPTDQPNVTVSLNSS